MPKRVSEQPITTTPTSDDRILILDDPAGTPAVRTTTAANLQLKTGRITQIVNTQTSAYASGSTTIPFDDTIPQNTEGDEYMTLAITPTSATNKLIIEVVALQGHNVSGTQIVAALFQDTTANALAAVYDRNPGSGGATTTMVLNYYMTAGTTSATTFKVRLGSPTAGTTYFNGESGARVLGGVAYSSITITEVLV